MRCARCGQIREESQRQEVVSFSDKKLIMVCHDDRSVSILNRNSIKTYHDLASTMPVRYAPGIAADINRERIRKEQAIEFRARQKAYQARRQDTTPGDRVVTSGN